MGSGHSKSAKITSNGNEGLKGLIEGKECSTDVTKEMLAKYLPVDRTETTQLQKLSSGECSQARRSTGETTNIPLNVSSQASKPTHSDHVQKFWSRDVFLCHSGKQKSFARQLFQDLTKQGVYSLFDEDPESLSMGEDFPTRIFEAAETCRLAVLILSKEFLESKWPMLELSIFVKARDRNPNLKILPLFFMIPPDALIHKEAFNENWKEFEKSRESWAEWHRALRVIRGFNGLKFREGGDELKFRAEIVKEILHILSTPSPRYHVPYMQGEVRMCQEVANFFNKVQPNKKGIRIAGLYGMAGQGKTTLGKAFCNLSLGNFEGRVSHLEFSRGDSFERIKLALRYLTDCPESHLQTLTNQEQAQVEWYMRVKGQRVLLVLDNITEESIGEVRYYVQADLRENSCILLSARMVNVLVKHFEIASQSCMRVPRLEEDEAIRILLERTSLEESTLGAEDKAFAQKCANRCSFKEISCDIDRRVRTFHPLALKAFGGHLYSKYGLNLSKWAAQIDGLEDRSGYGLDEVFAVLDKAFDSMRPKYRTIFMLLTVYMPPNMSPRKVTEWLAMNCNEEILYIEKAVEDLCKNGFIEEFEGKICIGDMYIVFAQSKAKEMGRWLWWKGDSPSTRGLLSKDNGGFELAKLEQCRYRNPSQIAPRYLKNLLVLQLVGVQNMSKLDFGRMDRLRSITLHDCKALTALDGMESLLELAWLQIIDVNPMFKLPKLSSLFGLQHLEIDIAVSLVLGRLGDLTHCFNLREINVRCPSLVEFPKLNGLPHLEKVEFSVCDKVKAPLDCRECAEIQSIVLDGCYQMAAPPLLSGCKKLSKIIMRECAAVMACPDIDVPNVLIELFISSKAASASKSLEFCYGLEKLQLWNMREVKELPSFRRLSNLTMLKLGKCGIRDPPDLTCCVMLEHVHFFTLKNLESFPNFSSLRKLKKLCLYNCRRVHDPPNIRECHELQVFDLLYNDNIKGLPNIDESPLLEEIKLSWHSEDEVTYEGIDPDSCEVDDDLESCLEHFKDEIVPNISDVSVPEALKEWQWLKGKTMLLKRYFRGVKLYYSLTAPYELYGRRQFSRQPIPGAVTAWDGSIESSERCGQNLITLRLIDSKVMASPTSGRVCKDRDWLNKVQKYFAGKNAGSDIFEKYLPMDQTESTQLKKLSRREYSQARGWTGETTKEPSQPNKSTRSDYAHKYLVKDVFLSHSGKQKNFVRKLQRDLENQGVSCFFDEDPESLPVGEDFPSLIFEAIKTCKVAVLVLSKDFLETKWPMLELSALVEARDTNRTNPNLKILPLFFLISPEALKNIGADNEKWKQLEISGEMRAEWHQALNAIRRINGLMFGDGGDEEVFRAKIVKEILHILQTPSARYHVPCMQGEARMCQEVADFFNSLHPNKKGIRIAGLYGMAGHGKTTLGKAFCNLNLGNFEGKVSHLEFSRGDSFERLKLALEYLTHCPQSLFQTLTSQDQAQVEFYKRVKGQRVLLVLDNITEESIDEVRYYVQADFSENSCILLSARSVYVLEKHLKIESQLCMRVPRLEEEEAICILLERTSVEESTLGAEDKAFAAKCANRCSFEETSCDDVRRTFHPLALKAFGGHLFSKYGSNLPKWVAEMDGLVDRSGYGLDDVFVVLSKDFDDMRPKYRTIFMLLTVYMLPDISPRKVTEWLAMSCNEEISFIEKAVEDLCKKGFIEEFEPEIRIHGLYIEFAQSKAKEIREIAVV